MGTYIAYEPFDMAHAKQVARDLVEKCELTPDRVRACIARFCGPPGPKPSPQLGLKHNYPRGRHSSRRGIGRMHW